MKKMNYQGKKPTNIKKLFEDIKSKHNAVVTNDANYTQIELPNEMALYFFTNLNHPAHQSVVIRKVVTENDKIKVKTTGYTNGNQQLFEQWIQYFVNQDSNIQKEFN